MKSQQNTVDIDLKDLFDDYLSTTLGFIYNTRINGRTIVNCKRKHISKKEIIDVLNLLHSDYHDLGMYINVHNSKWYTLMKRIDPLYPSINKNNFKNAFKGYYAGNHNQGKIDLFAYNHKKRTTKDKDKLKLFVLYDLLHEVRHAYQRVKKEKRYNISQKDYIMGGEIGYHAQWMERDANNFAQRMMNKHHDKINEILKIKNLEWYNVQNDWIFNK